MPPAQNKAGLFLPLITSTIWFTTRSWYKQGKEIVGGTEREQTAGLGVQKDCIYCSIPAKISVCRTPSSAAQLQPERKANPVLSADTGAV